MSQSVTRKKYGEWFSDTFGTGLDFTPPPVPVYEAVVSVTDDLGTREACVGRHAFQSDAWSDVAEVLSCIRPNSRGYVRFKTLRPGAE